MILYDILPKFCPVCYLPSTSKACTCHEEECPRPHRNRCEYCGTCKNVFETCHCVGFICPEGKERPIDFIFNELGLASWEKEGTWNCAIDAVRSRILQLLEDMYK